MAKEKGINPALAAHKARKDKERLKTQQSRLNTRLLTKLKTEGAARHELQAKIDKLSKSKGIKSKSKATSRVRKKLQELMSLQKLSAPEAPQKEGKSQSVFDRVERIARGEELEDEEETEEDLEDVEVKLNPTLTEKFLQGRLDVEALKEERLSRAEKASWMAEDMKRRVAGQVVAEKGAAKEKLDRLELPGNDEDEEDDEGEEDPVGSKREPVAVAPETVAAAAPIQPPSVNEEIRLEDLPPPPSIDSLMQACLSAQSPLVPRPPPRLIRQPPPPPAAEVYSPRPPPPPMLNFPRPPSQMRAPPPPLFVPTIVQQRRVAPTTFVQRPVAQPMVAASSGETLDKTLQFLDFLKSLPPTTTLPQTTNLS